MRCVAAAEEIFSYAVIQALNVQETVAGTTDLSLRNLRRIQRFHIQGNSIPSANWALDGHLLRVVAFA